MSEYGNNYDFNTGYTQRDREKEGEEGEREREIALIAGGLEPRLNTFEAR